MSHVFYAPIPTCSKDGKKILEAQKNIVPELIPITMEWAQSLQGKIKEAVEKAMKQE